MRTQRYQTRITVGTKPKIQFKMGKLLHYFLHFDSEKKMLFTNLDV